jgi:hypothetical protein
MTGMAAIPMPDQTADVVRERQRPGLRVPAVQGLTPACFAGFSDDFSNVI